MEEGIGNLESGALPWTHSCFVCGQDNPRGMHVRSLVNGSRVTIDYTVRETDCGYKGIMHGGLIGTLLDEAMTWAAILVSGRGCVAAELSVRMKKPVVAGLHVQITAEVELYRGRLISTRAQLSACEGGEALATGSAKYIPMSDTQVGPCLEDFVSAPGVLDPKLLFGRKRNAEPCQ